MASVEIIFMNEIIQAVVDYYNVTKSISKTSKKVNLSFSTVKRILYAAAVYSNDTSIRIDNERREHPDWDDARIAEKLQLSTKTVEMYSPYKGMSLRDDSDKTDAESCDIIVDEGTCGDHAEWKLSKSGTLTIYGEGSVFDYGGTAWGSWNGPQPKWRHRHDGIFVKKIIIESGITAIGQYAFSDLYELREVEFPDTLKVLRIGVFSAENQIRKIRIPEGVEVIPYDLFWLCVHLEEVWLPSSVKLIQSQAFHSCMSLKNVYFEGDAPEADDLAFEFCRDDMVIRVKDVTKGWDQTWMGFKVETR